jgi:hypothetical protein
MIVLHQVIHIMIKLIMCVRFVTIYIFNYSFFFFFFCISQPVLVIYSLIQEVCIHMNGVGKMVNGLGHKRKKEITNNNALVIVLNILMLNIQLALVVLVESVQMEHF